MRKIEDELESLRVASLLRGLRVLDGPQEVHVLLEGRAVLNFSSNDYLGLAASEMVREALHHGIDRFGAGAGASRLVCGSQRAHHDLETALAALKNTEAALSFSSGYAAAVGTLTALAGQNDYLIMDKLCHASLIDGARLSGAVMRIFPHNDMDRLDHLVRWAKAKAGLNSRIIVVTESVFSMDGDRADLVTIAGLRDEHEVLLMVDEAHSFGIMGAFGRGLADELGVANKVDIHMGTLSKSVGLHGGYVCGRRSLIDLLINRARSFIYSTAPPPAVAAAAAMVVADILPGPEGTRRRALLWDNLARFYHLVGDRIATPASAIIPLIIGPESIAVEESSRLLAAGIFLPAIRFPTVARGAARLRVALSATHTQDDVQKLTEALRI